MLRREPPHLVYGLRKILILTKNEGYVVRTLSGKSHDVESESNVDTLFLPHEGRHGRPISERYCLISISKGAGECRNSSGAKDCQLCRPEVMPERFISLVGDTGIEMDMTELPALRRADPSCQHERVVVRVSVTERFLCGVKQVLAIDEGVRSLGGWFGRQAGPPGKTKPRQRPCG